jgi:hypothetical protein
VYYGLEQLQRNLLAAGVWIYVTRLGNTPWEELVDYHALCVILHSKIGHSTIIFQNRYEVEDSARRTVAAKVKETKGRSDSTTSPRRLSRFAGSTTVVGSCERKRLATTTVEHIKNSGTNRYPEV